MGSEMGSQGREVLSKLRHFIAFLPIFLLLLVLGILKAAIVGPVILVTILVGNTVLILGMYPCHLLWTCYCILRTKKFGWVLKIVILALMPVPAVVWPISAFLATIFMALGSAIYLPLMGTFEAVREGVDDKFVRCFTDGMVSSIKTGCTIVRDFKDICFHTYFSLMDGLLEAKGDTILDIRLLQIPGCVMAGILGVLVDVPVLSFLVLLKVPIMLFKGWRQLIQDLIGRSGPFLETVCVPFAGLLILLWPTAVVLAAMAGILSSFGLGCYAAAVAYQENRTMSGILYVAAVISMFDEYTNDFLYLREGSCFPRPKYRKVVLSHSSSLSVKRVQEQHDLIPLKRPMVKTASMKLQELKAVVIWENFFKACDSLGKELVGAGAILLSDLEAWQTSNNKIVNIGLPSCVFLQCFVRSIAKGSTGFIMSDNVEMTHVNRPEGRVFDWLFEPMHILKEQIKAENLKPTEEAYLFKLTLYCGDTQRATSWQNGGVPPAEEVKRAQLEGLSRRLQGFSLTVSRMPTFRRRIDEVVKSLLEEARQQQAENGNGIEHAL
ncbi:uncharacterized membrane protein At3g27390-like [Typha angustifolia]|uniref:uncharacterized membrane protein At3g27390-like n=1 Tax=Typha angustifolia TaxID=59011 RepID=UPI003C2FBA16